MNAVKMRMSKAIVLLEMGNSLQVYVRAVKMLLAQFPGAERFDGSSTSDRVRPGEGIRRDCGIDVDATASHRKQSVAGQRCALRHRA
jgi:hypothetical protein